MVAVHRRNDARVVEVAGEAATALLRRMQLGVLPGVRLGRWQITGEYKLTILACRP